MRGAFTDTQGTTHTPGEAIEEFKRLNDGVDRLEQRWAETNAQLTRTNDLIDQALSGAVVAVVFLAVVAAGCIGLWHFLVWLRAKEVEDKS